MYYTGVPGIISGIDVDTSYFTGNYSPQVSIQAAVLSKGKASPTKENNTIFFLKVKKEWMEPKLFYFDLFAIFHCSGYFKKKSVVLLILWTSDQL